MHAVQAFVAGSICILEQSERNHYQSILKNAKPTTLQRIRVAISAMLGSATGGGKDRVAPMVSGIHSNGLSCVAPQL